MSSLSQFFGGSIKSIQRGVIAFAGTGVSSITTTISPVDTAKTRLRFLGFRSGASFSAQTFKLIELTNSTTITMTASGTGGSSSDVVSWELTEYN